MVHFCCQGNWSRARERGSRRGTMGQTVGFADGFGLLEETRKSPRPPQNWLFDAICNLWIPVIFHRLGSKGWCKILLDNPSFYKYSWTKVVFLTESSEGTRHVFQTGSGFLSHSLDYKQVAWYFIFDAFGTKHFVHTCWILVQRSWLKRGFMSKVSCSSGAFLGTKSWIWLVIEGHVSHLVVGGSKLWPILRSHWYPNDTFDMVMYRRRVCIG